MVALKEFTEQLSFLPKSPLQAAPPVESHIAISYAEWLDTFDEGTHTEWVDGEAIVFMPPTEEHQEVVTFLVEVLGSFIRHFGLGKLLAAPFEMKLTPESNAREPDILFVDKEHLTRLTGKRLEGPADLVVEVISPESVYRDRSDKFDEYQAAGVREYWLIDARPGQRQASFWVLDQNSRYRAAPIDDTGVYRSAVVSGFWFKVDWLWQPQKPSPILLLAEIVGRERLIAMLKTDQEK